MGPFSPLGESAQGQREVLSSISSTKTSRFESTSSERSAPSTGGPHPLASFRRRHSSSSLFWAEALPLQEPLYRRDAQGITGNALYKNSHVSAAHGSCGALLEVFFERFVDRFVDLGWPRFAVPRFERGSLGGQFPNVPLDG
jgi:hypothetical protein